MSKPLPDFLVRMASALPGEVPTNRVKHCMGLTVSFWRKVKKLESDDAWRGSLVRGLGAAVRAKHGLTQWSYVTVALLLQGSAFRRTTLQAGHIRV